MPGARLISELGIRQWSESLLLCACDDGVLPAFADAENVGGRDPMPARPLQPPGYKLRRSRIGSGATTGGY